MIESAVMMRFGRKLIDFVGVVSLTALIAIPLPLHAERIPDDTYFDNQWYLRQVGAPEAWESSLGFEGVVVALIDTGVDIDHPDLRDNIWRNEDEIPGNGIDDDRNGYIDDVQGWDFVDHDPDPRASVTSSDIWHSGVSHGTVSAGVIAAKGDNGIGITGITWQTRIMPIRALDKFGHGDPVSVVQAVEYAVRNGANVINLALAGSVEDDLLRIALRRAYDAGVFVVAAAGNAPDDGVSVNLDSSPRYPVCLDFGADENFVYGVAATDENDHRVNFSNFGAGCVDLSAPGYRYVATVPYRPGMPEFAEAYRGYFNGTSVAASLVSGAVALIKAMDSHLTPKQIANLLTSTAVRIDDINPGYYGRLGRGRLDVAAAVRRLKESLTVSEPPVATANLVPDGRLDGLVVAAARSGRENEIRMFTSDGAFVRSWRPFAEGFRGGVSLSLADFDGQGKKSIVAAAGPGGSPQVRIFDVNTAPIGGFMAYDQRFSGGVNVASGDIDGDGLDEMVTAPLSGGGPHVRIFSGRGTAIGGFFAYDENRRGGWEVAVGNMVGDDRQDEIVIMDSGSKELRVFTGRGERLAVIALENDLEGFGLAGAGGGVIVLRSRDSVDGRVVALNLAGDKLDDAGAMAAWKRLEHAVGAASGSSPLVRRRSPGRGELLFQVFESGFAGGVNAVMIQ